MEIFLNVGFPFEIEPLLVDFGMTGLVSDQVIRAVIFLDSAAAFVYQSIEIAIFLML